MLYTFSSELYEQFQLSLEQIDASLKKEAEKYEDAIRCIHSFLQQLETFVANNPFEDDAAEMDFFKAIYPRFYCWFIYYAELHSIQKLLPPHGTDVMLRDYYLQEYNYQLRFFNQNRSLYEYYLAEDQDRDEEYFLARNHSPLLPVPLDFPVNKRFLTNQGYNFAKFIAFERLQEHVGRRLRMLYRNPDGEYVQHILKGSKRQWTGDKVELIEIAYGIYYTRRMNEGKVDVRDIVEWLEDSLQVDLGDYYRMFLDLRRRKTLSYTKYLEEMIAAIRQHIEESHRFKAAKRRANAGD